MTKQEAVENHRKMWKWIAVQTLRQKRLVGKTEYLDNTKYYDICNACFCCEYVYDIDVNFIRDCSNYCPIDFGKHRHCCGDHTLYNEWRHLYYPSEYKKAALLAYKISKLPEK